MKMIKTVIGCNVVDGGSCGYACIWELYGGYMGGVWGVVAAEENDSNCGHDH